MKSLRTFTQVTLFLAMMSLGLDDARSQGFTAGTETTKTLGSLKPGEFYWEPQVAPEGPLVILVSIPGQTLSVFRNGIRIARSSVSTGARGHRTPTGVFQILAKYEKHRSSIYGSSMPYAQRLTWQGIALHAGNLPGYPASHGCVRLPLEFSKRLFGLTQRGATVIIADDQTPAPTFAAQPGILLAPKDFKPEMLKPLAKDEYEWKPERSLQGPISILASVADRTVYVYRNGEPIGRAALSVEDVRKPIGGHVFTLLEGVTGFGSPWAPGRPGRKWMSVKLDAAGQETSFQDLAKSLRVSPAFAEHLYSIVVPGTTVVVTDEPATRRTQSDKDFVIINDR